MFQQTLFATIAKQITIKKESIFDNSIVEVKNFTDVNIESAINKGSKILKVHLNDQELAKISRTLKQKNSCTIVAGYYKLTVTK